MHEPAFHAAPPEPASQLGEPVWEIAYLFPPQGSWSAEQYLALGTNRLIEFDHGSLEVLPMPTLAHQLIAQSLALEGAAYRTHGRFQRGETATSALLPGFSVGVTEVFAVAERLPKTEP